MQTVHLNVSGDERISLNVAEDGALNLATEQVRNVYIERPVYDGSLTITPSADAQVLDTKGKRFTGNLTVAPIPNNYGLITWNGAYLTIS